MLKSLRIQNYALIDDLNVEFAPGLNVLTGETGAGKSIIVGAFSLLLGEKADSDMIRTGRESAVVEGVFRECHMTDGECHVAEISPFGKIQNLFSELAIGDQRDDGVVIRRKVTRNGKSTALVNDHSVSNATLKRLGDILVDLHGQHEHQSLLNRDLHLLVLDDFAGLTQAREQVTEIYADYRARERELASLRADLAAKRERRDLTEFQYRELLAARLIPDEIANLNAEKELVESAEKRLTLVRELLGILADDEGAVQEQLSIARRKLGTLAELDDQLATSCGDLNQAVSVLDELWRNLVKYRDTIEVLPGRLDEINERLFMLERLVRKLRPHGSGGHGGPPLLERSAIEELIVQRDNLGQELAGLEVDESRVPVMAQELAGVRARLIKAAQGLSAARKKARVKFEAKLAREFAELGLTKARLTVRMERRDEGKGIGGQGSGLGDQTPTPDLMRIDETGCDDIEFLFTANPGEEPRPLRKIASGGELSRIMLALKSVLAASDQVPVMVFDEIDAGIGGRIADAVGRKLSRIAGRGAGRQVICITHLPQIARFAATHFKVSKAAQGERTQTRLVRLTPAERVEEIARMLAGTEITAAARTHAREMLNEVRE